MSGGGERKPDDPEDQTPPNPESGSSHQSEEKGEPSRPIPAAAGEVDLSQRSEAEADLSRRSEAKADSAGFNHITDAPDGLDEFKRKILINLGA